MKTFAVFFDTPNKKGEKNMKNFTRILLLMAALVLAMSMTAVAEEVAPEGEEAAASTIAYIFWQDQDWWPAVWSQADDYWTPTPATVTGEGWYTVKVDAHMPSWFYSGGNSNIGAQKLAIVVKDGQDLFPGMYLQIVDIHLSGSGIDLDGIADPVRRNGDNQILTDIDIDAEAGEGDGTLAEFDFQCLTGLLHDQLILGFCRCILRYMDALGMFIGLNGDGTGGPVDFDVPDLGRYFILLSCCYGLYVFCLFVGVDSSALDIVILIKNTHQNKR